MRFRNIFIFLSLVLMASCSGRGKFSAELKDAISELDKTIGDEAVIEMSKTDRIAKLKSGLSHQGSPEEMYWTMNELFNEYFQYDVDSAIFYAHRKLDIARQIPSQELTLDALFDIADRYAMSGMNDEALRIVEKMDTSDFDPDLCKRRYSLLNTAYTNLRNSACDPELVKRYSDRKNICRELMLKCLGPNDIARAYIGSDILMEEGQGEEALEELLVWAEEEDINLNEKGILCYSIASAYKYIGDRQNAMIWLAKSAKYDLQVPKYEYQSLIELSGMLYEEGDIERAYTYINRAVNDAVRAKAQNCKEDVYKLMPIIADSYDRMMKNKNDQMRFILIAMALMMVMLVILTGVLFKEKKRVAEAEKMTRESNRQLKNLNSQLQDNILLLQETNQIKDSYLGRYLNMCSDYIDGLDRYRSSIRKIAKEEGVSELLTALKSKEFMEQELKGFYAQFDATFLDLFPDFIPQLNELLEEDKQIKVHSKNKILSTELRVLALIRLGVNDSVRIAHFLRRSVSTIYNYRVKMKNSTKIDREEFEKELMKIGKRL
ncbi:MAG: DUF6377 domain-containing protein [Candidatus Cryptobacteroides sp.]